MVHMRTLSTEKEEAIRLRKQGKTYNEILEVIPVAKSTLSLWLRDVGLAKKQQQRITERRILARQKGSLARKNDRIMREEQIIASARNEIGMLNDRELMLVGASLYWAEGCKAKPHKISQGLDFGNTDVRMVLVYIAWLTRSLSVDVGRIGASIYIHENCKHRIDEVRRYWLRATGLPATCIRYICYKKNLIKTKRKNVGDAYNGLFRIKVTASTDLNRKVQGWTLGISEQYGSIEQHCRVV